MNKPGHYLMPPQLQGSPVMWNYDMMKENSGKVGYIKIDLKTEVALQLAEMSPYPRGVKLGVMKQVADSKAVTLRQMGILLGWAADRAQR